VVGCGQPGAISPLVQKQDQLNQLDSHTQLCVQRMGNPIWLEPKGTDVEKFTGEPGLVVKYNMLGTSGLGKPERIPAEAIPSTNFQLRQQYMQDIEEMAGTYDVLKGQKPTGVEAFSALQLLVERSQSRFTTAFAIARRGVSELVPHRTGVGAQVWPDAAHLVVARPQWHVDIPDVPAG
jgi:hypothetical protein